MLFRSVVEKATTSQIQVGAGISKRSELNASSRYGVSKVICHPTLDAALLILSRNLPIGNNIKTIDILNSNKSSLYNVGNTVFITGWVLMHQE